MERLRTRPKLDWFRDIIASDQFQRSESKLTLALGFSHPVAVDAPELNLLIARGIRRRARTRP